MAIANTLLRIKIASETEVHGSVKCIVFLFSQYYDENNNNSDVFSPSLSQVRTQWYILIYKIWFFFLSVYAKYSTVFSVGTQFSFVYNFAHWKYVFHLSLKNWMRNKRQSRKTKPYVWINVFFGSYELILQKYPRTLF